MPDDAGRAMEPRRLRPDHRLRLKREFDRVFAEGHHASDSTLVVVAAANGRDHSRIGLIVSRRVGSAVTRNRWKRRIREAFRIQRHDLPKGLDYVVRPARDAEARFASIGPSLSGLAHRLARRIERERTARARRAPTTAEDRPPGSAPRPEEGR
ncbi:MAG: ribonuclease P protein component [Planctomycetes bacterium]|nr:ribonuclease P protein component [Planctomycetota bacterium]